MITVTKINDRDIIVNCEHIELIETTPDTILTLSSGRQVIVLDTPEEIVKKTVAYKRHIYMQPKTITT